MLNLGWIFTLLLGWLSQAFQGLVTSGGEERFKSEHELHYLKPTLVFDLNPSLDEVSERLGEIF
jgi:hypothetical protein